MSEKRELPYTPPDIVVGADPFGRRRQRPAANGRLDTLIGTQQEVQAAQTSESRQAELLRTEAEVWSTFFGEPIEVPPPPPELLTFLRYLDDNNIGHMEAHYLPPKEIYSKDEDGYHLHEYPGMHAPPSDSYRALLEDLAPFTGLYELTTRADLPGKWIVTDTYYKDQDNDDPDPYAEILSRVRAPGSPRYHPDSESRRAMIVTDINGYALREIEEAMSLQRGQMRLMGYLEYNMLGNAFHPEWGDRTDMIWFNNQCISTEEDMGIQRNIYEKTYGGSADNGNALSDFAIAKRYEDYPLEKIGFKPVIVFP